MDKKTKRAECRKIRKELKYEDFSLKITNLREYKNAKTVFIYVSFADEAKTDAFLNQALKEKKVLVPFCTDEKGSMIACEIKSTDDLKEGMYGIREPENPEEFKGEIDLSVIPGLAFSKDGYRIGYGKGYYDRFLSGKSEFNIGLTFDELLFDELPHNEYDKKTDMIITPRKELRIK